MRTSNLKQEIEDLFHEAADLPVEAREVYFQERGVDTLSRRELEELFAFDSQTSSTLEGDICDVAAQTLSRAEATDILCGPYRLGDLLGRGGMGAVYLAERVDGEVSQRVAVKLLRSGMDIPLLRRRFLAERQILANLSHPHIARLLDAGHREDGLPYLVMEYVRGKAIDTFTGALGVREKISVFLKVCGAVAYLHRNLVVHRDLKPANILMTEDGEPKLLDFGIARILDLTSDSTTTNLRMLTPDYASPEQMAGGSVSTASDIYSLGAVLYRLLTGQSPRRAPLHAIPELRGDLEFILLKALRQEPQERYSTVDQFAEDLESFLAGQAIRARKDDTWYRARKVLRRYWMFVAAGAVVVASLAAGLYVANRQRVVAERRFAQLRQLSKRVVELDSAMEALPGAMAARQRLVAASLEYLDGLRRESGGNPELAHEVADGYWHVGRIQGVNTGHNLGDTAKAEESLKKADDLIQSALSARPEDRSVRLQAAVITHDRMLLADTDERRSDALAHAHRAVSYLESLLQGGASTETERERAANLYGNIALGHVNMHLYADGARYARRAVQLARTLKPGRSIPAQVQGLGVLANALRYQGDLESALTTVHEARELLSKADSLNETTRFFMSYGVFLREGFILGEVDAINLNRPAEAAAVMEQALILTNTAAGKDAKDSASRSRVGTTARVLGSILSDRDPARALAVFDIGIGRLAEAGKGRVNLRERAVLLAKSAYPLRLLGRTPEGKGRIDEALAILKETGDYPSQKIRLASPAWTVLSAQAAHEAATGNLRRGLETYEHLFEEVMATKPESLSDLRDAPKLSRMYESLAILNNSTGNQTRAALMNSWRMELWSHWQQELPQNAWVRRQFEAARQASENLSRQSKISAPNAQVSLWG